MQSRASIDRGNSPPTFFFSFLYNISLVYELISVDYTPCRCDSYENSGFADSPPNSFPSCRSPPPLLCPCPPPPPPLPCHPFCSRLPRLHAVRETEALLHFAPGPEHLCHRADRTGLSVDPEGAAQPRQNFLRSTLTCERKHRILRKFLRKILRGGEAVVWGLEYNRFFMWQG